MNDSVKTGQLVIMRGTSSFSWDKDQFNNFVYYIDTPICNFSRVEVINDSILLHSYARDIRDKYSQWIYKINEHFLDGKIIKKDLSLFFLTDISCKRTEIFDTFNSICNLLVIKEKIKEKKVTNAILVGVDKSFFLSFSSMFPEIKATLINQDVSKNKLIRIVGSDLIFLAKIFSIGLLNSFRKNRYGSSRKSGGRYLFSPYPQHLKPENSGAEDIKCRGFIRKEDKYLVSILMDGFHQNVNLREYMRLKNNLLPDRFVLLDQSIYPLDVLIGVFWIIRCQTYLFFKRRKKDMFLDIDISSYVKKELTVSFSRLPRLMMIEKQLRRFFKNERVDEFVYYLFEYPFGRLLSYVAGTVENRPTRIGFQHGPASWIKMLYFLAPGEISQKSAFLKHVPVPDKVMAEDLSSLEIYKYSGYSNVQVMKDIYRLDYLANVEINPTTRNVLIVPGLHDGYLLLASMEQFINDNPKITCYFRPHPRANNTYVSYFRNLTNLNVSTEPIDVLMRDVSRVFVTYSSVGMEAKTIGLEVTIVDIPGKLNETPLLDRNGGR